MMKRYTKKGPRRSRAMPVSSRRFVVTDYDGCGYITAGKAYPAAVCSKTGNLMKIRCEDGDDIPIAAPHAPFPCSHIDERRWRWAAL